MNNDIKVYINDENKLFIAWDESDYADSYSVLLTDDSFTEYTYKEVKDNNIIIPKKDLEKYFAIRIEYTLNDNEYDKKHILGYSNEYKFNETKEIKELSLSAIKSYNGITISFFSKDIYDIYKLYKVENNNLVLLEITEDFQVTSKNIKENDNYLVQAFKKEKNDYVLCASSNIYTCKIKNVERKSKRIPKIAIIVPVYNSKVFSAGCIDSV